MQPSSSPSFRHRLTSVAIVVGVLTGACGTTGGDEENIESPEPTTVPTCDTVPSADVLAALPGSLDEMRAQLPLMHDLYDDNVVVLDQFGIRPNHIMLDGLPRMLIFAPHTDGRCEEILEAVARPDLVRLVEWTEQEASDAFEIGGLPPWRHLMKADMGYTRDGNPGDALWTSIGTGRYGVISVELRADQEELAATMLERYGELIKLSVGNFPFPADRIDPAVEIPCGTLPIGDPPVAVTIASQILRGDLYSGQFEVVVANAGTTTVHLVPARVAELTEPGSLKQVSAFTGFQSADERSSTILEPGGEVTIAASPSAAACSIETGYALPAGDYDLVFPIYVFDSEASEGDRSSVLLLPRIAVELE